VVLLALACNGGSGNGETGSDRAATGVDPIDARCTLPSASDTLYHDGSAVLLSWTMDADSVYSAPVVPADSAFLAYRHAIRNDGADLRRPIADTPTPANDVEADLWENERYNSDLAQRGAAGSIAPITCLDALLFAHQHARISQIEQPTEFIASVLRKADGGTSQLRIFFGADLEMFPPKTVYGFNEAEDLVADGWEYLYVLHNHTIQRNGERLALGTPALSTSDVQLMRSLTADVGLKSARVTNGFFTYTVAATEFDRLRSR